MTGATNINGVTIGGWFYYGPSQRSTSWAGVDQLYEFLINETYLWTLGPSGMELNSPIGLEIGDIIQYDWKNVSPQDTWVFNHSVIVVSASNAGYPLIASHSPELYMFPYTYFISLHQQNDYPVRVHYIHILSSTRDAYLPSITKSGVTLTSGYPAPGQNLSTNNNINASYPAPVQNNKSAEPGQAYPAP